MFIRTWRKLYPEVKIKVVFVHETLPEELEPYREHIIHFPPVKGLPVDFTSQYIRLLYPALLGEEGGVMVADVDAVPMNRRYFSSSIRRFADDAFVSYRRPYERLLRWGHRSVDRSAGDSAAKPQKTEKATGMFPQIYIQYNVANSKVWGEVFGVQAVADIPAKLRAAWEKYYRKTNTWYIDQIGLCLAVEAWNLKTRRHVIVPRRPWRPLSLHLPNYMAAKSSLRLKPNGFFWVLLRFCIKLEIFSRCSLIRFDQYQDKVPLSSNTLSCQEVNERVVGCLSSRPLPRLITLFRPLMSLAYRGTMLVCRAIKKP